MNSFTRIQVSYYYNPSNIMPGRTNKRKEVEQDSSDETQSAPLNKIRRTGYETIANP